MINKQTILLITEYFPHSENGEARGGVEMRAWHIAKRLAKDFSVNILTSREAGQESTDRFLGMTIHRVGPERVYAHGGSLWQRMEFMRAIGPAIRKIKPDVIDAQSLVAYAPAFRAARAIGIPIVVTIHDVWRGRWVKLFGITGLLGELYERYTLSQPWDFIIANSNVTKKNLTDQGIVPQKIEVIYNGIDLDTIRQLNVSKEQRPTIISIARLVPYKRVSDLLEATALVRKQMPSLQVRLIGSGPEKERLQAIIQKLNLGDTVTLLGFVEHHNDVLRYLKQAHVFCLTSEVEGFGIVVAEAMAAGVPVVAADIPPVREVTGDGTGGVLYSVGDIPSLAQALLRLLQGTEVSQLTRRANAIVDTYDWDSAAAQTKKIYQTLL